MEGLDGSVAGAIVAGDIISVFEQETTKQNKQKIITMLRIIVFNLFKVDQKNILPKLIYLTVSHTIFKTLPPLFTDLHHTHMTIGLGSQVQHIIPHGKTR